MGANESKPNQGDSSSTAPTVTNYYELLGVQEDATQDEVKRAFRRLALIHHPDKNQDNVEEANQKFSALQQAYEVLSDEQERAWYDSHRASLIPEADADVVFEDIKRGVNLSSRVKDRGLTVSHLTRFFDISIWEAVDDSDKGFYTIYRNLFSRLASEEAHYTSDHLFPSFGVSTWPWSSAAKGSEESTRDFYNVWTNFTTEKDFSWVDKWNLSEAPDRRVRRLMEKDNKKARDDARREYNDTVRSLAKFIRKRDPRYKRHLEAQNSTASAPKPQPTADKPHKPAAETYVEQDWQKVDTKHMHADLDWAAAEGEEEEEWECVACRKSFRSEAAWDSHERSKKHLKEIERLKWEMQEEDEALGLDEEPPADGEPILDDGPVVDEEIIVDEDALDEESVVDKEPKLEPPVSDSESEPSVASREKIPDPIETLGRHEEEGLPKRRGKARKRQVLEEVLEISASERQEEVAADDLPPDQPQATKRDKRRARQQAKAEAGSTSGATAHRCNVCSEEFGSKTKLFNHISQSGHALATGDTPSTNKTKKKRR